MEDVESPSAVVLNAREMACMGKRSETEGLGVSLEFIQSIVKNEEGGERDPFYVMDAGGVLSLWKKWASCLPRVRPYYAVKCNPNRAILRTLAAFGSGFDCASRAEMEAVLAVGVSAVGVSPEDIIYANPCKGETHIKYSAGVGIHLTTFDSAEEIDKLRKHHPRTAALLRLNLDVVVDSRARRPLGSKYGALPEEVAPLLKHAHEAGIAVRGVSFHVGSAASNPEAFGGAIAVARRAFDAALELGLPRMQVLDIGGGFIVGPNFENTARVITAALSSHFGDFADFESDLTVIAEPGRFFSETAFTLATNIIGKRVRGDLREYWINDGIYGSMNCILYDKATVEAVPLACASNPGNPSCTGMKTHRSTVFGPTCDALDKVLSDYLLPELEVDDWLVFPNMGAYTTAAGSNFNGFSTAAIGTRVAFFDPPTLPA